MRAAAHQPAPKCGHCRGFGCEPDVYPMMTCGKCGGAGRPKAAPPPPQNAELLDG